MSTITMRRIPWSWQCALPLSCMALVLLYYYHTGPEPDLPRTVVGKVFDCRTWETVDLKMVEGTGDHEEIVDYEKHENRLESWKKDWVNQEKGVPKSGVGSTLEVTRNIRQALISIVEKLKIYLKKDIISILDSPCGDMTWIPAFLQGRQDVEYTGYDLIPMNIENAKANFSNEKWTFQQFDLMKDRIKKSFDLVINRHVSIHLGLLDSIQMFHNIEESGSKYLLTTTFPDVTHNDQLRYSNEEVSGRSYHQVNLHLYPFLLPPPICQNEDAPGQGNQYIALWRLSDLTEFKSKNRERFRDFRESA